MKAVANGLLLHFEYFEVLAMDLNSLAKLNFELLNHLEEQLLVLHNELPRMMIPKLRIALKIQSMQIVIAM